MGQMHVFGWWERDAVPGDMEHMQIQKEQKLHTKRPWPGM